jgi:hypothetical protein
MAVPTFKDELDDLPVTTAAATAATAAAPATAPAPAAKSAITVEDDDDPKAVKKTAAAEELEDLTVDFGDRELMKKTGMLERIRPEKGKAVRFALLTDFVKARMSWTHFIDKKGSYRCLGDKIRRTPQFKCVTCGGVVVTSETRPTKTCKCTTPFPGDPEFPAYCCKKLKEDPERTFVALVVYYKNANPEDGGYEKGTPIQWEIRYVQLTAPNYRSISRLIEEEVVDPSGQTRPGTAVDMDIVMIHADKAFGYEFHKKAARPKFRQNPELFAEVVEKLKPFLDGVKLDGRLGRKVTDLEMKALIASLGPGAEDAKLGDVESL